MRAWIFAALFLSSPALAEPSGEESNSGEVSAESDLSIESGEENSVRRPLPPLSEDGLTEAGDEEVDATPGDATTSTNGGGSVEADAGYETTATGPSYADGMAGKIEDGRRFVWAAYGVSWAVLILFTLSVIRRWQAQEKSEQSS